MFVDDPKEALIVWEIRCCLDALENGISIAEDHLEAARKAEERANPFDVCFSADLCACFFNTPKETLSDEQIRKGVKDMKRQAAKSRQLAKEWTARSKSAMADIHNIISDATPEELAILLAHADSEIRALTVANLSTRESG